MESLDIRKRPKTTGALLFVALLFLYTPSDGVPVFDSERAFTLLEKQCAFGPRVPNSAPHRAQLKWMTAELSKLKGAQVSLDSFTHIDKRRKSSLKLTNVSVVFKGKAPGRRLFCAHWDCRPWCDQDPNPNMRNTPVTGANDGASGVAVLMETCRLLSQSTPPVTIEILLFDGEDYGMNDDQWCLGSKRFAERIKKSDYNFAILLDMIGDKDLSIPMEMNSLNLAPQLTMRIFETAVKLNLPAFKKQNGIAIYDDHMPLLEKGIPSVDLIDFDYRYWHTTADTPDKCSKESLGQVGKLIVQLMYE
ncbi:MAG: M28 family peptidase [Fibrobacteres bacterium]|nr:M28 family peptidase [Fibrobacterota bacterium]